RATRADRGRVGDQRGTADAGIAVGTDAQTDTQAVAAAPAARVCDLRAGGDLPRLWHGHAAYRRGRERDAGICAGALQGDSPCATEAHLVRPLVDALGRYVLAASKLHADDTPVPVLQPGRGVTKTGRLWTYVRDDRPAGSAEAPAVWFQYSPDRKGERPVAHLKHFTGILQADGYAGFDRLYERGDIMEAACWAHVRRNFYDLHVANDSSIAAVALTRIGALYAIETEI